jgi:hypothetical protein
MASESPTTRPRPRLPRWALEASESAARSDRRRRVLGPPLVCLLERGVGREAPCCRGECVFYRVPGTRMDCAVEEWAPGAERDARVAEWFLHLRDSVGRDTG